MAFRFTDNPENGITFEARLEAIEEACQEDDVPFLVDAVRHFRKAALRAHHAILRNDSKYEALDILSDALGLPRLE